MASLVTTMSALDAVAAYEVIDALAHADEATDADGNRKSIDARRADAVLATLGLGGQVDSVDRPQVVRHIEMQLVSDVPTWLGLADNPVELLGYGHLPGAVVRQLRRDGADVALRRLIADPITGELLDSAQDHRPPRGLRESHPKPATGPADFRVVCERRSTATSITARRGTRRPYLEGELWLPVSTPSQTEDARRVAASLPSRWHCVVDESGRSAVQRAAAASTQS